MKNCIYSITITRLLTGTLLMAGMAPLSAVYALDTTDREFIQESVTGGKAEEALGQIASQKSSLDEVRDFGSRMIEEHSELNRNLVALAKTDGVTISEELPTEKTKEIERLRLLPEAEFNREYTSKMVSDHQKNIARFETRAKETDDQEFKRELQKALPVLRGHLIHAEKIKAAALHGS